MSHKRTNGPLVLTMHAKFAVFSLNAGPKICSELTEMTMYTRLDKTLLQRLYWDVNYFFLTSFRKQYLSKVLFLFFVKKEQVKDMECHWSCP